MRIILTIIRDSNHGATNIFTCRTVMSHVAQAAFSLTISIAVIGTPISLLLAMLAHHSVIHMLALSVPV